MTRLAHFTICLTAGQMIYSTKVAWKTSDNIPRYLTILENKDVSAYKDYEANIKANVQYLPFLRTDIVFSQLLVYF